MKCADVRLEEYLDGELAAAEREKVEGHLASCDSCRAEGEGFHRLEELLRRTPAGAPPDVEPFVSRVRARSRRAAGWGFGAAAAIFVVGVLGFFGVRSRGTVDARAELAKYAAAPSGEIKERIRSTGPRGLRVLEAALEDKNGKLQCAAAALLFEVGDDAARGRLTARFQAGREPGEGYTLPEIGLEEDDADLEPLAISMALEGREREAMDVLRKLNRPNGRARGKIVDSVVTLLKSDNVRVQKLALDIVRELGLEFPLSSIVDLLDSPELGGPALNVLRGATGKDFGKDKEAWRKVVHIREGA